MGTGTNSAFRLLDDPDEPSGARVRRVGGLTFWAETLAFRTTAAREFIDVTDQVAGVLRRSKVTQGWTSVFSKHTTAAVVLNENEPLLLQDMGAMLERLSAAAGLYQHNDLSRRTGEMDPSECANGHAHCQHLLIGASENIPVADGRLDLGRWQRIFLLELDRPRDRQLVVQVFGA
ncbi:MAG TPA: secondary thiamine-phosphate synthase enzyme YjbQ [Candidatus Acidoferrum sp.]|nr:secondary thiamine-phosphate synthase enzyme YjbQ [Candidatus Acidoferrum sp.]